MQLLWMSQLQLLLVNRSECNKASYSPTWFLFFPRLCIFSRIPSVLRVCVAKLSLALKEEEEEEISFLCKELLDDSARVLSFDRLA